MAITDQKMKIKIIIEIISFLLMLLFAYTAISKLVDHESFRNVLLASPLLNPIANLVAWLLPFTEFGIVFLLFIPSTKLKGVYASLILISLFTLYLLYMIAFTPHLPCNCGGVIKLLTWPQHILFNLFFIFLSLIGIVLYRRAKRLQSNTPP